MWARVLAIFTVAWAVLAWAEPPPKEKVAKKPAAPPTLSKDLAPPVALPAEGKSINVDVGHAAPWVADFAGDGALHLLVGQFGDGKLRIYRNGGPRTEPRFGKFTWFQAGGKDGKVPAG